MNKKRHAMGVAVESLFFLITPTSSNRLARPRPRPTLSDLRCSFSLNHYEGFSCLIQGCEFDCKINSEKTAEDDNRVVSH